MLHLSRTGNRLCLCRNWRSIMWSRRRAAGADMMLARPSVRRITLDEEHDATGYVATTLLKCKVTAQIEVNGSC